jgi:transposase-like protein
MEFLKVKLLQAAYMPMTFLNDDAIVKMLYLAIQSAPDKWTRPIPNW